MAAILEKYDDQLPVAVDVLGGDDLNAVWDGILAARVEGLPMILVGPESQIRHLGIEYIDADVQVPMDTSGPDILQWTRGSQAGESSMYRAAQAVKDGRASAVISAGSSAGMYAIAHHVLGFQKRSSRPGIATSIPRLADMSGYNVLCDSGAHIDPTPEQMVYNAVLAAVVARVRHGNVDPAVSFLANGEEPTKGDAVTKAARHILSEILLPVGHFLAENVEGKHLTTGPADVIVTNGLLGNGVLKTLEGGAKSALFGYANFLGSKLATATFADLYELAPHLRDTIRRLEAAMTAQEATTLVTSLAGTALIEFGYGPAHPDSYGGAVVPGMNGIVVIGHGSIKSKGVPNAVRTSLDLSSSGLVAATADAIGGFTIPPELALEAKQKYKLVDVKDN